MTNSERKLEFTFAKNEMLSYHRYTVLQGALVSYKSGRLELLDNIL